MLVFFSTKEYGKMKKLLISLVVMSFVCAGAAQAITVENFSFELPGTEKKGNWEEVPGWSSDIVATDSGVELGSDGYGTTEGVWAAYIMGDYPGAAPPLNPVEPAIWQLTDHTIAAGESFILTVDLQDNWSETTAEMQLRLYYDDAGVRMPVATVVVNPVRNSWTEFSLPFSADDVPDSIGQKLGIEIDNILVGESWVGMDNIQLVPEPATMALLSIGGLALLRRRRA